MSILIISELLPARSASRSSGVKDGSIGDPKSLVTELDWLIPPKVLPPAGSIKQN